MSNTSLIEGNRAIPDDENSKLRAAYALNMCTVSVSQIIDYNDINVLEQEYEAILNNINLEQMPKDDALLDILRQLLDTITYFRIHEGEKQMLEKEYQQKMKNAIWSAVPNFGMVVAGGSPLTMAVSLASQVGIGYMNYRKNKSEYALAQERQQWELQITAIEQFNGLRRALFTTAWRLADAYNFPDVYRLTEKQITQYNKILMDPDEMRKYERLESIKDKFEAYPPFWYFLGHSAFYIAGDKKLNLSPDTRTAFLQNASEYFEKYEKLEAFSVLREDPIAASCALEHIDLILLGPSPEKEKIEKLLKQAVELSGNASDILQLCALTYLKIGQTTEAARMLRNLVNEDYNRIVNAQLLSSIYVHNRNKVDYELLATRVDKSYLFPMPDSGATDIKALESAFGQKQKDALKQKVVLSLDYLVHKYARDWNRITSIFEPGVSYPESYFDETSRASAERMARARKIFTDAKKTQIYQDSMRNAGYELSLLNLLNKLVQAVFTFKLFNGTELRSRVEGSVKDSIAYNRGDINELQKAMSEGSFELSGYKLAQTITLRSIFGNALSVLSKYAITTIDKADLNTIATLESDLLAFCIEQGITEPDVILSTDVQANNGESDYNDPFGAEMFGLQAESAKKKAEFLDAMTKFAQGKLSAADLTDNQTCIYFRGEDGFESHFHDTTYENRSNIKSHAIMVLKDFSKRRFDLIFTTAGIVNVERGKIKYVTPYHEITRKGNSLILFRKHEYKCTSLSVDKLYDLIQKLGGCFLDSLADRTEYVPYMVTIAELNQWFKQCSEAMSENAVRLYAIPRSDVLEKLHIRSNSEETLDLDHNLLQCYYDKNTGEIMGLRVVEFEEIESNFQGMLIEKNGILRVGR